MEFMKFHNIQKIEEIDMFKFITALFGRSKIEC